jgi:hypothetical protein
MFLFWDASTVPAFRSAVFSIIATRADEQMIRIETWRIIAAVQNAQSIWNNPVASLIGHPMREPLLAFCSC